MTLTIFITMSKLHHITHLLSELEQCCKEISQFEKAARTMANNKSTIKLTMEVLDQDAKAKEEGKMRMDADGSLEQAAGLYGYLSGRPTWMEQMLGMSPKKQVSPFANTLEMEVSDVQALEVLGIMLRHKVERRDTIKKDLLKLGIQV